MCSCFFQAFLTSCNGENIELLNDLVRRGGGSGEPVLGDPLGNLTLQVMSPSYCHFNHFKDFH